MLAQTWAPVLRSAHATATASGVWTPVARSTNFVRRAPVCNARSVSVHAKRKQGGGGRKGAKEPQFLVIDEYGSNMWELDGIAEAIRGGAVGILPTDTHPAIVCDLMNKEATERLYKLRALNTVEARKRLSILCRGLHDVDTYTLGWPASNVPGAPSMFKSVKRAVPGAYTFILHSSKALPKIQTDSGKKQSAKRTTVGVRIPDNQFCAYVLDQLDAPLLCTSAHVAEDSEIMAEIPDAATMAQNYPGLDFVVDVGVQIVQPSTVIDMTAPEPELIREGRGDPAVFGL